MATTTTTNSPSSGPGGGDGWFFAGLVSSYPNITSRAAREPYFKLAWPQPCGRAAPVADDPTGEKQQQQKQQQPLAPGCRVFHPRPSSAAGAEEIGIDAAPGEDAWAMREQVVVFRYEGALHAVDHACPHRAFSLAWGRPLDVEDAARGGAVVGRAVRCGGHGYAFELSAGAGDRGGYRLGVWEVEVRPRREGGGVVLGGEADGEEGEVWVRRRRRREAGA